MHNVALACADDLASPMNYEHKYSKPFPNILFQPKKALCNSSGVFRNDRTGLISVPGMALFGLNPTPEAPNPMHQVTI